MAQRFYIFQGNEMQGPFELLTVIRKIRNGDIHAGTPIATSESDPAQPAESYPMLQDVFAELNSDHLPEQETSNRMNLNFGRSIQHGYDYLKRHIMMIPGSGLPLLLLFGLALVLYTNDFSNFFKLLTVSHLFSTMTFFAFYVVYYAILRTNREQNVDISVLFECIRHHGGQLLGQALVMAFVLTIPIALMSGNITLASAVGFLIGFVLLMFLATYYIFAPLLVMEKGIHFMTAMETSRLTVQRLGADNIGVIFGLVALNGSAALFVFPLVLTLPITLAAICDIYDGIYNS